MREKVRQVQTVRLGSRGSDLALWQTEHIRELLLQAWPDIQVEVTVFSTKGDQILDTPLPLIGGKGLFTAELEGALHQGTIDAAVHSLKDLPTEAPTGLTIGAVPGRANPADALVSRDQYTIETLPQGATVGTSSRRRASQLLKARPDLQIADIRGNVPTRIRKALDPEGPFQAVILAYAGLARLGRLEAISQIIPLEIMMPAPGQGALGVQCRDEAFSLATVAPLNEAETRSAVTAERSFLSGLGGGCAVPIAAYAQVAGDTMTLQGRILTLDGSQTIDVVGTATADDAAQLGLNLAQEALAQGAATLLWEGA